MARYTVLLYPEPDGSAYNVVVPSMPGVSTFGDTVEEALANAHEAMTGWLLSEQGRGFDLPDGDVEPIVTAVNVELPVTAVASS
jgi:predicted RNase H-like HicB family nuclease